MAILAGGLSRRMLNYGGSFSPWMYVLGPLLEDGVPFPLSLEGKGVYRTIFGGWILSCVLLTNFYNGLMITGLNSPLPSTTPETFKELVCDWREVKRPFAHYKKMRGNNTLSKIGNFDFEYYLDFVVKLFKGEITAPGDAYSLSKCFSLLSQQSNEAARETRLPAFFHYLRRAFLDYYTAKDAQLKTFQLVMNLFHPNHRHFPLNTKNISQISVEEGWKRVEREVVDCSKTVFIATEKTFRAEIEYLAKKYFWIKFHQSKQSLVLEYSALVFVNPGISRVPLHYKGLVESGIFERLDNEFESHKNFKRERAGEFKPQRSKFTMDGCISTLFILCAGLAGVGFLAFGWEWMKGKGFNCLRKYFRNIWIIVVTRYHGIKELQLESRKIVVESLQECK